MNARRLITIAVVALLVVGGAAALGAASPADQATDDAADVADERNDDRTEATPGEDRPENAAGVGPSDGLPEQVPDHVSDVHDRIESFLDGSIEGLGDALSGLLGDEGGEPVATGEAVRWVSDRHARPGATDRNPRDERADRQLYWL